MKFLYSFYIHEKFLFLFLSIFMKIVDFFLTGLTSLDTEGDICCLPVNPASGATTGQLVTRVPA